MEHCNYVTQRNKKWGEKERHIAGGNYDHMETQKLGCAERTQSRTQKTETRQKKTKRKINKLR